MSALISCFSGLLRWFWYTPLWASMLSLEKKKEEEFSPSARFIYCMCVLVRSVFCERTLSSGAGRGSALFHIGLISTRLPPLPGQVIKAASVNPADVDKFYPIKTIKRRYWFNFKAPGFDFGMQTLVSTDPWRKQRCHDK